MTYKHKEIDVLPMQLLLDVMRESSRYYGLADIKKRAFDPLFTRCTADRQSYFFSPYRRPTQGLAGFVAGPFLAGFFIYSPAVAMFAVSAAALGELFIGLASLIKSIGCLMQGDRQKAGEYLKDGLTRLLLSPCLLVLAVVAIPVELVRFITRLGVTIIEAIKGKQAPEPKPKPVEVQPPAAAEASAPPRRLSIQLVNY